MRAPDMEADLIEGERMTVAETLLLPFDGLIAHCGYVRDFTLVEEDAFDGARVGEELRACRLDGHVARTARQFVRLVPDARRRLVEEMRGRGRDFTRDPGFVAPPQHAGALAGLDWEERTRAMDDAVADVFDQGVGEIVEKIADERLVGGRPTSSFETVLSRLDRGLLERMAQRFGARVTPRMAKAKLASAVYEAAPKDLEGVLGTTILRGTLDLEGVRRIFEAGGRIDVAKDDTETLALMPTGSFPAVFSFRVADTFSFVLSDAAAASLEGADWDALERRAARFDRICRYAHLATQFRGAVDVREVVRDAMVRLDLSEESASSLIFALGERQGTMRDDYVLANVDERTYLVSPDLALPDEEGRTRLEETSAIHELLDEQDGYEPRDVWELSGDHEDIWVWALEQQAVRDLVQYLDAHVPEGIGDYHFAMGLVGDLFDVAMRYPRTAETQDMLLAVCESSDFGVGEADADRFEGLLEAFLGVVPNWYANGWGSLEAARHQRRP